MSIKIRRQSHVTLSSGSIEALPTGEVGRRLFARGDVSDVRLEKVTTSAAKVIHAHDILTDYFMDLVSLAEDFKNMDMRKEVLKIIKDSRITSAHSQTSMREISLMRRNLIFVLRRCSLPLLMEISKVRAPPFFGGIVLSMHAFLEGLSSVAAETKERYLKRKFKYFIEHANFDLALVAAMTLEKNRARGKYLKEVYFRYLWDGDLDAATDLIESIGPRVWGREKNGVYYMHAKLLFLDGRVDEGVKKIGKISHTPADYAWYNKAHILAALEMMKLERTEEAQSHVEKLYVTRQAVLLMLKVGNVYQTTRIIPSLSRRRDGSFDFLWLSRFYEEAVEDKDAALAEVVTSVIPESREKVIALLHSGKNEEAYEVALSLLGKMKSHSLYLVCKSYRESGNISEAKKIAIEMETGYYKGLALLEVGHLDSAMITDEVLQALEQKCGCHTEGSCKLMLAVCRKCYESDIVADIYPKVNLMKTSFLKMELLLALGKTLHAEALLVHLEGRDKDLGHKALVDHYFGVGEIERVVEHASLIEDRAHFGEHYIRWALTLHEQGLRGEAREIVSFMQTSVRKVDAYLKVGAYARANTLAETFPEGAVRARNESLSLVGRAYVEKKWYSPAWNVIESLSSSVHRMQVVEKYFEVLFIHER